MILTVVKKYANSEKNLRLRSNKFLYENFCYRYADKLLS
jgi:hypothetical protein